MTEDEAMGKIKKSMNAAKKRLGAVSPDYSFLERRVAEAVDDKDLMWTLIRRIDRDGHLWD